MASDERLTSFWIPARELGITWGNDRRYWKWTSLTDLPESEEVAELLRVSWLEIKGTVELKKLLIDTSYSAYLVFKLKEGSYGLKNEIGRVRFISERKDPEDVEECSVLLDGEQISGEGGRLPQARGKWWMEIKLGEFFNDLGDDDDDDDGRSVEAALLEVQKHSWKSGLIVKGIEVRPNFLIMGDEVVSSYLRSKFSSILHEIEADSPSEIVSRFRSIERLINFICENSASTCRSASRDSSIPVNLLYDLIDALSACRVFAQERLHKVAASKEVMKFKKNMSKRLDAIERELKNESRPDQNTRPNPPGLVIPQTHPVCEASEIIGFESEAEKIKALLLMAASRNEEEEEEAEGLTGIGIVGRRSGCGKTALAQKIFATPTIQEKFSPRIWVCLSTINLFDNDNRLDPRVRVLIHILEQIGHDISELEDADLSVVKLLEKLQRGLLRKRYLIVLDDAWRVDEWFADLGYTLPRGYPMGEFFSHGLPKRSGGAIIVTSQSENVVKEMVGDKHVIRLESKLSDENCWKIFSHLVQQQGIENPDLDPKLNKIKIDVIRKCDGLPLGAKILADVIVGKNSNVLDKHVLN